MPEEEEDLYALRGSALASLWRPQAAKCRHTAAAHGPHAPPAAQAAADKSAPEQAVDDQLAAEQIVAEQAAAGQSAAEQVAADQPATEQAAADAQQVEAEDTNGQQTAAHASAIQQQAAGKVADPTSAGALAAARSTADSLPGSPSHAAAVHSQALPANTPLSASFGLTPQVSRPTRHSLELTPQSFGPTPQSSWPTPRSLGPTPHSPGLSGDLGKIANTNPRALPDSHQTTGQQQHANQTVSVVHRHSHTSTKSAAKAIILTEVCNEAVADAVDAERMEGVADRAVSATVASVTTASVMTASATTASAAVAASATAVSATVTETATPAHGDTVTHGGNLIRITEMAATELDVTTSYSRAQVGHGSSL